MFRPRRLTVGILAPLLLATVSLGCSEDEVTPSSTDPTPTTAVVGDGAGVDLEPGSNLPPTDSDRSGDDSLPTNTMPGGG
jgi:hypothetical protein